MTTNEFLFLVILLTGFGACLLCLSIFNYRVMIKEKLGALVLVMNIFGLFFFLYLLLRFFSRKGWM